MKTAWGTTMHDAHNRRTIVSEPRQMKPHHNAMFPLYLKTILFSMCAYRVLRWISNVHTTVIQWMFSFSCLWIFMELISTTIFQLKISNLYSTIGNYTVECWHTFSTGPFLGWRRMCAFYNSATITFISYTCIFIYFFLYL